MRAMALYWSLLFFAMGLLGPLIAPQTSGALHLRAAYLLPNTTHWLGTSTNGVDILSALLHGTRTAALVSIVVVVVSASLGTVIGTLAGYAQGSIDRAFRALADLLQTFPALVINISLLALTTTPSLGHVIFALIVPSWIAYARIARAQAIALRSREFVVAAQALGASHTRILTRHVLPNLLTPIIVQATTHCGSAILAEATLSFLGIGPSVSASWGGLLAEGTAVLLPYPHVSLIAGSVIALTIFSFNQSGDWLYEKLRR